MEGPTSLCRFPRCRIVAMRPLLSVFLVVFAAGPACFAADEWGEPVNGLSIRVWIALGGVPSSASFPAIQFALRGSGSSDVIVALGRLMNDRRIPSSLELVSRGSDGALRAIPYSALKGITGPSGPLRPWTVTIRPKDTFTFQEPRTSFFALSLATGGELWVELRVPDPAKAGCEGRCWSGTAFSNIVRIAQ